MLTTVVAWFCGNLGRNENGDRPHLLVENLLVIIHLIDKCRNGSYYICRILATRMLIVAGLSARAAHFRMAEFDNLCGDEHVIGYDHAYYAVSRELW